MPRVWQLWLGLLMAVNVVVPLFFLGRREAWFVLLAIAVAAIVMTVLAAVAGFTRILGLGHFVWFPLLYYLWTRLGHWPADDLFGIWIRALILLNGTSLVIDVVDVLRYLAGDRGETVDGLT